MSVRESLDITVFKSVQKFFSHIGAEVSLNGHPSFELL